MIFDGMEVNQLAWIHLILEAKFGDDPLSIVTFWHDDLAIQFYEGITNFSLDL